MKELLNILKPKEIVKTINQIDFKKLKAKGINALIMDIDDTLIPREENQISPMIFEWIVTRKEEGFKMCLASNSRHPLRVKYLGDTLGLPAISLGFKPLPFAFWNSLKILDAKPEETAMIGDQLFMDILGANMLNIYTIFVHHKKSEDILIRTWMRNAEEWVLSKLTPSKIV
ncbi:MAG: YqeG family HAD IIIA-type phosphatase [Candidatus Margulisiibacteriota bacterium]